MQEIADFKKLPSELHVRLTLVLYKDLIAQCPFFHPLSSALVVSLMHELQPLVCCPRQLVIVEGEAIKALFLIVQARSAGAPVASLR